MIVRLLFFIAVIATAGTAFSSECTMNPAPVDIKRIAHNPLVKSYVVDVGTLSLTALLKNGRALRLIHTGCEHSGAEVSMWLDSERPFSDTDGWIKEASALVKIAFPVDVANDILNNIKSGDFKKETTEARVVISAAPSSFMTYTIVVSRAESGLLLTISFVLG